MAKTVLIDSGAIIAALSRRDRYHAWAISHFQAFTEPCLSCEAVLSESFFMLRRMGENIEVLCKLLERGIIVTQFSFERHVRQSTGLMRRYRDTPMSFADACLVRMSEIHEDAQIFTTDSDFAIYRRNGRQVIPLIMPR